MKESKGEFYVKLLMTAALAGFGTSVLGHLIDSQVLAEIGMFILAVSLPMMLLIAIWIY